jgi:hypothetical protein
MISTIGQRLRRFPVSCLAIVGLAGCNVVPPLDCLMGVERPGCHRDASGIYHYLYTSPLLPAPNSDAIPVGYAPITDRPVTYQAPPMYVPPMHQQTIRLKTTCMPMGGWTFCQ